MNDFFLSKHILMSLDFIRKLLAEQIQSFLSWRYRTYHYQSFVLYAVTKQRFSAYLCDLPTATGLCVNGEQLIIGHI